MEVTVKQNLAKHLTRLFIIIFTMTFAGLSAAHDGEMHGARIATTWLIGDAINTYEVNAPLNPPLRYVKMRFMAHTGLPVKHAEHYIVEKVVTSTTSTYTRDPSVPPTTVTTTSYVLLDDSMSLKELGIVDGDTLRISEMPDHDLSAPHHNNLLDAHHRHDRDRHDHDHHGH